MVLWRFAWREAQQKPGRFLLTLLSIVIGVAAVVAVTIAAGTTRRAFDEIYQTVAGRAQLEISASVGTSFDEKVVDDVRSVPGVQAVAPLIERRVPLYVGKNKHYILTALGVDPAHDREVRDYEVTAGGMFSKENPGILLHENFAKTAGIEVGDSVDLATRHGFLTTTVVGLYKTEGTAATNEGSALMMMLSAAQIVFKTPQKVDKAQIVLAAGVSEPAVRAKISDRLPDGLSVHPPPARSPMAEETSLSTEQGMNMARGFSVVAAVFIVLNTFLISVTQRRKQIGVMRAIGSTRAQIAGMILRESMLMGIIGTVAGSVLGVAGAHYMTAAMGTLYEAKLPPIELTIWPFVLGGLIGVLGSVIAAAYPAFKASHLSPLEAMRDVLHEEIEGTSWSLVATGALLVVVFGCAMAASILGWLPMMHAVWSAVLVLVGLALMLPLGLGPMSLAVAYMLRPLWGIESRLARLQLLRHHSRTTLTVLVLFIVAATGIGLTNSIIDNVEDVRTWYRKAIVADFFLRSTAPDMRTGLAADLPDSVGKELEKLRAQGIGITSMDGVRYSSGVKAAGESGLLVARDYSSLEIPDFDVVSGDKASLSQHLEEGEVALGSVWAERSKLKVGDSITLETDEGAKPFRVAAIVNDYLAGGLTIHMERDVARRELGIDGVDAYVIKADHERLDQVREELEKIRARYGLMIESWSDIQQKIDRMMSGVVGALWAMAALLLLASAVGVTNTLAINVLEQTRELGLLRVVAMTRSQARNTVFTQAIIMALLALIPGIVAGIGVAYLINLATLPVTGHAVSYTLHPALLGGAFVLGLLVVALAALIPANRAAGLDLPTALRMA